MADVDANFFFMSFSARGSNASAGISPSRPWICTGRIFLLIDSLVVGPEPPDQRGPAVINQFWKDRKISHYVVDCKQNHKLKKDFCFCSEPAVEKD